MDAIDMELNDVKTRLSKLYDAIKTGKLDLDDLSPRIKELKARNNELLKARVQFEADMVVQQIQHVDIETIQSYAQDLRSLFEETDLSLTKTFLRSFVKRIEINGGQGTIEYNLPVPLEEKKRLVGVLPIDTLSGPEGVRTPYLLNANQAFSQLNYGPLRGHNNIVL
jgi:site-specific DNA recombinase